MRCPNCRHYWGQKEMRFAQHCPNCHRDPSNPEPRYFYLLMRSPPVRFHFGNATVYEAFPQSYPAGFLERQAAF